MDRIRSTKHTACISYRSVVPPLLVQRVPRRVRADAGGVLLCVAAAADALVAFQCATDIVRREDDGRSAVDVHAFELRLDLADARGERLSVVVGLRLRVSQADVTDVV